MADRVRVRLVAPLSLSIKALSVIFQIINNLNKSTQNNFSSCIITTLNYLGITPKVGLTTLIFLFRFRLISVQTSLNQVIYTLTKVNYINSTKYFLDKNIQFLLNCILNTFSLIPLKRTYHLHFLLSYQAFKSQEGIICQKMIPSRLLRV